MSRDENIGGKKQFSISLRLRRNVVNFLVNKL